jgi:hypothetical protein
MPSKITRWTQIRGIATSRLLGRLTAGTGQAEELSSADILNWLSVYTVAEINAGSLTFTALPQSSAVPSSGSDLVNKTYVDAFAQGLEIKDAVRVATTTAGTLATSFENGDTIDGVVLVTGDRILIKDQASGSENGIYTVNASGAPTRAVDADASSEVGQGTFMLVLEGTVNAFNQFAQTTPNPTLDSTSLVYTTLSSPTGSITLTGDVTGSGTGSFTTTIGAGTVTLAKMANMATASLIYRKTAGTGAPEVQTLATLKTDLGLTGTNSGDQTIITTIGTAGSDVNLAGSTLNIPDASATVRGVVTTGGQTWAGQKTFSSNPYASGYFYAAIGFYVYLKAGFQSPSDGIMTLRSWSGTGDFILQFGNTTSAAAAIKRIGTLLEVKLADDSAYTNLKCLGLTVTGALTAASARIPKRVGSTTSGATINVDSDLYETYKVTALAEGATIAAPTGTPTDRQTLIYQIKDDGTGRALSWNAVFRVVGDTLPTTTVSSKLTVVGCIWDSVDSKWNVMVVSQEA